MTRSRGVRIIAGGAIISLFIATGSATAIDIEPTSATLTPQVLKEIAQVESRDRSHRGADRRSS